jgi:hypothetical protein
MAHTILDKVVATVFIPKQDKKTKKWKAIHRDQHLNPSPNWRLVRDRMIEQKNDWQYAYSARTLQLAVQDLGKAWKASLIRLTLIGASQSSVPREIHGKALKPIEPKSKTGDFGLKCLEKRLIRMTGLASSFQKSRCQAKLA